MARTIAAMDNANIPDTILGRTARTWEVELLISGVAVFAMLQLPGWLDDRVFERLDGAAVRERLASVVQDDDLRKYIL